MLLTALLLRLHNPCLLFNYRPPLSVPVHLVSTVKMIYGHLVLVFWRRWRVLEVSSMSANSDNARKKLLFYTNLLLDFAFFANFLGVCIFWQAAVPLPATAPWRAVWPAWWQKPSAETGDIDSFSPSHWCFSTAGILLYFSDEQTSYLIFVTYPTYGVCGEKSVMWWISDF